MIIRQSLLERAMNSKYKHLSRFACLVLLASVSVFVVVTASVPASVAEEADASVINATPAPIVETDGLIPFAAPDSHKGNWIRYHGSSVDLSVSSADPGGKTCLACHGRNDCTECHNTTMPRDHNNTWRTRTHGISAEGNRERCLNCHRQDYCVRCHNETTPRSHRGRWADGGHCGWCHYGSGLAPADKCGVCHRSASHGSAPHVVSPSLDCSACHP